MSANETTNPAVLADLRYYDELFDLVRRNKANSLADAADEWLGLALELTTMIADADLPQERLTAHYTVADVAAVCVQLGRLARGAHDRQAARAVAHDQAAARLEVEA